MRLKLPHFPRIITATILPGVANLALWVLLIGLVSFNAIVHTTLPLSYQDKIYEVFTQTHSWETHMQLAKGLWQHGSRVTAQNELALASELFAKASQTQQNSRVLGASTNPNDLLQEWTSEPARLVSQKLFWQGIAISHPDYRDAYIQLAAITYSQGNLTQTREFLQKASVLDPNGKATHDLLEFIEKKLK